MNRVISWFSCGAASAVATKLALKKYNNVIVVRIIVKDEDADNDRFAKECEEWFGVPIINLINEEYGGSVDAVIAKRKYMGGVKGAPCTQNLKKKVRKDFQEPDDRHVFGFHVGEEHREGRILDSEPDLDILMPLIDAGLEKDDCKAILEKQGIEIPAVYRMGFKNANCRGCVKGSSAWYWNNVRKHFPETFEIRSRQEKLTGAKMCKMSAKKYQRLFPELWEKMTTSEPKCFSIDKTGTLRFPLRYLQDGYAEKSPEPTPDCGILCEIANKEISE